MVKITNANQFAKMVSELEQNPTLAKGFKRGTVPPNFKGQWQGIATKINALGPPLRDGEEWQKVWRDLKCKVKRKLVHNNSEINSTGGGTFQQIMLSPLEEQVANLLQFGKQVCPKGNPQGIPERGTVHQVTITNVEVLRAKTPPIPPEDLDVTMDEQTYEVICLNTTADTHEHCVPPVDNTADELTGGQNDACVAATSRRGRNRERNKKESLLESHSQMQERMLKQVSSSLAGIENKLASVESSQTDTSAILQKLVDTEKKKLKIMERQQDREEALYKTEMKLKRIKMEIKEAELDIIKIRKSKEMK